MLVVQGESDPFGMPPDAPDRTVARVKGDHGLKADRVADRGRDQILAPRRASSANARPMTMPIKLLETRSKATVSPSKSTALSISKAVGVTITTSQKYPRSRSA